MGYQIPKDLKGEERLFSIPYINVHLNKKGVLYCGSVSIVAGLLGKLTNVWVFILVFLLNFIAYPLAQMKVPNKNFDCGGMAYDKYFLKKFKYKRHKNVYIKRRHK